MGGTNTPCYKWGVQNAKYIASSGHPLLFIYVEHCTIKHSKPTHLDSRVYRKAGQVYFTGTASKCKAYESAIEMLHLMNLDSYF